MNLIKTKFLLILAFLCMLQLEGQVKKIGLPDIRNYKKTDYKGGTQNWSIDQDSNGNMYFANNNGLLQFDGSSWKKYTLPSSNAIRCLKIHSSGRIYIGGYKEFGYFKPDSKGILKYTSLSELALTTNVKLIDFVWKIHFYGDAVIFQCFAGAYIYKNNHLTSVKAPTNFQFSFSLNNKIYFQDGKLGILEYSNNKLRSLKNTTLLNNTEIWGMFPLDDKILIATIEKGLFILENEKLTQWETDANEFVKKNNSLGGVSISNKYIVLNSVLNGLIICDYNGRIIQHINRDKGLQNNTVLSSFVDNKKNLWLGLDNGIAYINETSPFTYFGFSYDISSVYSSVIYKNNLYVATNQGVFYHSWNADFKEDVFKMVQGATTQSWNVQVINDQLICANNRGALIIKNGTTSEMLDNQGYFGFKEIPNNPKYIIGANYGGFAIFEKTLNGIKFRNQVKGFQKSSISFELDKNYLWLKKDSYLYQLQLSDDLTRFTTIKEIDNLSKKHKGITSIQKINNIVYFQTQNHFYTYSDEQTLFFEDQKFSLLFSKTPIISELSQDQLGNLWYVFKESLGVLIKNGNSYKNQIDTFSNLTGNLIENYLSVNAIDKDNIFIGLTDGLAHYSPGALSNMNVKPNAFIRSFSFLGDTVMTGNGKINLETLDVPYSSNHVKFTFSSPTYENLENVKYSYKLAPFDEDWSPWSNITLKEYTNLREGKYTMMLKVRNSYGVQSKPTFLSFSVSPPWYRHFIAYIVYVILILVSIKVTSDRIKMKIRKNKYYETIEQRRLYLEKESRIRKEQYELEKEIEKLKNDNLKIQLLSKDKELVTNSLQVAKKNKILNGIINKIKDIDINKLDEDSKFQVTRLNKSIAKEVSNDKSWKDLEKHIKNVHFDFLKRLKLKHPTISPRELDLSTYLLMNMSTKEIAEIMNISSGGVELSRYRLRKKLGLNKKENLVGYLMQI